MKNAQAHKFRTKATIATTGLSGKLGDDDSLIVELYSKPTVASTHLLVDALMGRIVGVHQNSVGNRELVLGWGVEEPSNLDASTVRFFAHSILPHSLHRSAEVGGRCNRGEGGKNSSRELHFVGWRCDNEALEKFASEDYEFDFVSGAFFSSCHPELRRFDWSVSDSFVG